MKTPVLETDRIILRPLIFSDAKEVYDNWASDKEVGRFMRWPVHKSIKVTEAWLKLEEKNIDSIKEYNFGFVHKENGMLIGSGGLVYKEDIKAYELGYNLMKKYWGQGIATEVCSEILAFAKDKLNEEKVFVCHAKENIRSERVIIKLGFEYLRDGMDYNFDHSKSFETREYIINL